MGPVSIDNPENFHSIRTIIGRKKALRRFYEAAYEDFKVCISDRPKDSPVVELGSGASFANEHIPEIVTTDILPYPGISKTIDAMEMLFMDKSIGAFVMLNVFHHIPNIERFLSEASRVLMSGGKICIVDQYAGPFSKLIYKYFHHESFDPYSAEWSFASTGPLSGANGALTTIVFFRDRRRFEVLYPHLKIVRIRRHTPLFYWLSGGLKSWSLIPGFLIDAIYSIDQAVARVLPEMSSFVTIDIRRG
jgi:SAM-dependent methyltransferase